MMYCSCGYDKKCPIWCGNGHENGDCPPKTTKKPKLNNAPACSYCDELAPYGDARNQWIDWHTSWLHKTMSKFRSRHVR